MGCDLQVRQRTIAVVDTKTGVSPRRHFAIKEMSYESFLCGRGGSGC